jgi:uncharacterized protein (UPF0332 family)
MNQLLNKKLKALDYFKEQVLSDPEVQKSTAKMILFGSVCDKKVRPDSDVDILIFSFSPNKKSVQNKIYQIAFDSTVKYAQSVEPLIYSYLNYQFPAESVFLQKVLKQGKEIYTMDKKQIIKQEAQNYLDLAQDYFIEAKDLAKKRRVSSFRLSIDAGYNAAELAVKGLLLLKTGKVPKTHGGVVSEFGKCFVLACEVSRQAGRDLSAGLNYRNKARYDKSAIITSEMKRGVLNLAKVLIGLLETKMRV